MSINLTAFMVVLLGTASSFFNSLIPIFGLLLGITVGIGLLYMVYRLLSGLFPTR